MSTVPYLKRIAAENESFYEKNPFRGGCTIPVPVSTLHKHKPLIKQDCSIEFQKTTSERAILDIYAKDKTAKIAVLNFADRKIPGGFYLQGVQTQEESLCRAIPGLYRSLYYSNAYPYQSYDTLLWTPNVYLHRDPTDLKYTWLDSPIPLSVVSAAAPNLAAGEEYHDKKFVRLLEAVLLCPHLFGESNVLVLGRMGCGTFKNDPVVVAQAFAKALKKHGGLYKRIVFAIPEEKHLESFVKHLDASAKQDKMYY